MDRAEGKKKMSDRKMAVYLGFSGILIALFLLCFVVKPGGNQNQVFFKGTADYMADYYNVAKFSADRNPYYYGLEDSNAAQHAYPPLAYLIFYIRSRFADYLNLSSFEAGATSMGKLTSTFAVFLEMGLLVLLLHDNLKKKGIYRNLVTGTFVFSGIFLFSMERGNIIGLAAFCTAFFVLYYNSESRFLRELALLALAAAAALKVYPALLGILLIYNRKWKEAVRCVIYGAALFFLPFLFFEGGFKNIEILLRNVQLNSKTYETGMFPRFNFRFWTARIADEVLRTKINRVMSIVDYVICIGAVLLAGFQRTEWKRIMLILLVIVILPLNSAEYTGLYLFVGIVLFLNEREFRWMDMLYVTLFVLLLNPFQLVVSGVNITCVLMNLSVSVMIVLLSMEVLGNIMKRKADSRIKITSGGGW